MCDEGRIQPPFCASYTDLLIHATQVAKKLLLLYLVELPTSPGLHTLRCLEHFTVRGERDYDRTFCLCVSVCLCKQMCGFCSSAIAHSSRREMVMIEKTSDLHNQPPLSQVEERLVRRWVPDATRD